MLFIQTISFPGLGIGPMNPPQTLPFTIFGREIYLYGVVIALGFLLAILYGRYRCKDFGYDFDLVTDAVLFSVPAAIICARIYYVAFRWDVYASNPISVLYIWEGGIAIYGGIIGAVIGLLLFSLVKKQPLAPYLDLAGLGLLIGQLVGRWGNFFNREAYGSTPPDDFFLRMVLTEGGVSESVHPTFLYESVWNLIGFLMLHFFSKSRHRKFDGQVFLGYVCWYGLGRVWIEGLRTDSLYLPHTAIRVSQLLAALSFFVALGLLLYILLVKKPDGSRMLVRQAAPQNSSPSSDVHEKDSDVQDADETTDDAQAAPEAMISPENKE